VILGLAILVEHRLVTDRRTHNDSIYHVNIASSGKNHYYYWCSSFLSAYDYNYGQCYLSCLIVISATEISHHSLYQKYQ